MGYLIINGLMVFAGIGIGVAIGKKNKVTDLFDGISDEHKEKINKFTGRLSDWFFGPDIPDHVDTYTQKTPDVIKKDSLSAK